MVISLLFDHMRYTNDRAQTRLDLLCGIIVCVAIPPTWDISWGHVVIPPQTRPSYIVTGAGAGASASASAVDANRASSAVVIEGA